jgi:hypothetical protein
MPVASVHRVVLAMMVLCSPARNGPAPFLHCRALRVVPSSGLGKDSKTKGPLYKEEGGGINPVMVSKRPFGNSYLI